MNYSKLEGKEVKYIDRHGAIRTAIVTGFDKDFGLTIQEKDTKEYIMCLVGHASPLIKNCIGPSKKHLQKLNRLAAEMIQKGVFEVKQILRLYEKGIKRSPKYAKSTEKTCPFSQ